MTEEHYPAEVLARSRNLFHQIRPWIWDRNDVTLIGGWAVYELVHKDHAQQSRDIDLVMHTRDALYDFDRSLSGWGLSWRRKGRNTFNDCHLSDDPDKEIVVDVLLNEGVDQAILRGPRMRSAPLHKNVSRVTPLPTVDWLIEDKLDTIPRRVRDAEDKRIKDFMDIHNLIFYNTQDHTPRELRKITTAPPETVTFLLQAHARNRQLYAARYEAELSRLHEWLTGP